MYDLLLAELNPWWSDTHARASRTQPRRTLQATIKRRLTRTDRRATVLVGPRQVGKTTILRQCIDDLLSEGWPAGNITYFDFSDDRITNLPQSPREILEQLPAGHAPSHRRALLLDEVSRIRGWADWLKQAVDRDNHRIVVTDSAAHLLHHGGRESGLGRWDEVHIEGLTYREFLDFQGLPGETADLVQQRLANPLDAFLFGGGFPEHVSNGSLEEIRRRIRADIGERALLRDLIDTGVDLHRVRDLFIYLMDDSGAIFDRNARSRMLVRSGEDQPDKRSMERWLNLLIDTRLIVRVDPFAKLATGRLGGRANPKLYGFDQGLISAFAASPRPFADAKLRGQVTEAAVLRAIRSISDGTDTDATQITYARDVAESDFVVDWNGKRTVVEVTAGADPRRKLNGVREMAKQCHASRSVVVHGGLETDPAGTVAPLHAFLLNPRSFIERDA